MSFLPGHFPAGAPANIEKLTSLTFIGAAGGGAASTTIPVTVREGDFLIFYAIGGEVGGVAASVPTGFTSLVQRWGSGNTAVSVSARIAETGDAGDTINGVPGAGDFNNIALLHFRGNSKIRSFSAAQDIEYQETSGNPGNVEVGASAATTPAIIFGMAWTSGAEAGSGFSPNEDATVNLDPALDIAYTIFDIGDTPFNQDIDMGDNGGHNHLLGFYLNFT